MAMAPMISGESLAPIGPCFRYFAQRGELEVVELDCGPEERFQPTVEQLAALELPADERLTVEACLRQVDFLERPERLGRAAVRHPGAMKLHLVQARASLPRSPPIAYARDHLPPSSAPCSATNADWSCTNRQSP